MSDDVEGASPAPGTASDEGTDRQRSQERLSAQLPEPGAPAGPPHEHADPPDEPMMDGSGPQEYSDDEE